MASDERLRRLSRELLIASFAAEGSMPQWVLDRMGRWLDERRVAAGDTVYVEGDAPEGVYFMNRGRLRFTRAGGRSMVRDGRWVFGVHEAIADRPRRRTVTALTDLDLVIAPVEPFLELVEDSAQLARNMALGMARDVTGLHAAVGEDGGFPEPTRARGTTGFSLVERLLVLGQAPLVHGAGVQALTDLASAAEPVEIGPGDLVFGQGVGRRHMHFVADGIVEVRRDAPRVAARFGPGSVAGGAVALGDQALDWEARAMTPARLLAVPTEVWGDEMNDHFDLFRCAIAALSDDREQLLDRMAAASPDELVLT